MKPTDRGARIEGVSSLVCVVDVNILDRIVGEPGMLERVCRATDTGHLVLRLTSRQQRELENTPQALREQLGRVPVTVVGSAPFILGVSRLGIDRLGPDESYRSLRGNHQGDNHIEDHLGVATARLDGVSFVTDEKRLRRHARDRAAVEVWDWPELRRQIVALSADVADETT